MHINHPLRQSPLSASVKGDGWKVVYKGDIWRGLLKGTVKGYGWRERSRGTGPGDGKREWSKGTVKWSFDCPLRTSPFTIPLTVPVDHTLWLSLSTIPFGYPPCTPLFSHPLWLMPFSTGPFNILPPPFWPSPFEFYPYPSKYQQYNVTITFYGNRIQLIL